MKIKSNRLTDEEQKKIEFFDQLVFAKRNRTGTFQERLKEAMAWGLNRAEREARQRIEMRRQRKNQQPWWAQ